MQTGMIDTAAPNAAATTANAKAPKAPSSAMDKNAFLQLLVAQLKNQDPTQSQDPNQMVQQMTSYSTLEQAQNTNSLLTGMTSQNNGMFQTNTASLLGKKVRAASSNFDLKNGQASVGVDLPSAAKVTVSIHDAKGKVIDQLEPGAMTAGNHQLAWDGKDAQGHLMADGSYTVTIDAVGIDGNPVKANTSGYLTVNAVSFVNGAVMLTAGGKQFSLSDVTEISA